MKHTTSLLCALTASVSLIAFSAFAQEADTATAQRVEHLEHDLQLLQKQVSRGTPGAPISDADVSNAGGSAQLEVRLGAIEEQMRTLQGKNEENEFQIKKLNDTFEKFQKDTEFRFTDMQAHPAAAATPAPIASDADDAVARKPITQGKTDSALPKPLTSTKPQGPTTAGDGTLHLPPADQADTGDNSFATPRDLYNYAFRLLNQTKYPEAAASFESFTKQYPKDPLVGNAYYWEGETYYIRRDFVNAADNFRQGFEALPDGPKAADNLLKLAMSLDALQRDKEACVVLQQVTTKFKKSSASITDKATQEQKRIGCK